MQTSLIAWAGESLDQPGLHHTVDEPRQPALAEEECGRELAHREALADSSSRLSTLRTRRVCERRTARSSLVLRSDEGKAEGKNA